MAGEFKIKTGLLLGPSPTQPVISIQDTSISITQDASSILVTGKAIYDFHSANSLWDVSTDTTTVYLKDPSDNVELSYIEMAQDGGPLLMADMPVSAPSGEQSYSMSIDGSSALKIYGNGNGSALRETAVIVGATYFALGDPTVAGSWRFRINGGELLIEEYNGSSWVEKGKFS